MSKRGWVLLATVVIAFVSALLVSRAAPDSGPSGATPTGTPSKATKLPDNREVPAIPSLDLPSDPLPDLHTPTPTPTATQAPPTATAIPESTAVTPAPTAPPGDDGGNGGGGGGSGGGVVGGG